MFNHRYADWHVAILVLTRNGLPMMIDFIAEGNKLNKLRLAL